jgi:DNA-binding transcriptional LysR family regulator
MNLRQLRYFVTVAEELHFHRAARRLNITQSPLTLAIQELEREVGGKLLSRTNRRVELTEAGCAFLRDAHEILEKVRLSLLTTRGLIANEGMPFRLGLAPGTTLSPFLAASIRDFCSANPAIRLTVTELASGNEVDALQARELDVCVVRSSTSSQSKSIELVPLLRDRLVVAMHREHPLKDHSPLRVADLRDEQFILHGRESDSDLRQLVTSLCARQSFTPRVVQEVRDTSSMLGLAAARLGVAILPSELSRVYMPDVLLVPLADQDATTDVCVAFRSAENDPRVASLCQMAVAQAKRTYSHSTG